MKPDASPQEALHGFDVSRETFEKLVILVEELGRWQAIKNLVGPGTLRDVWRRHVADSLQLLDLAPRGVRPPPTPVGVRDALLTMSRDPVELTDVAWRTEPQHDPSAPLRAFTALRDRTPKVSVVPETL